MVANFVRVARLSVPVLASMCLFVSPVFGQFGNEWLRLTQVTDVLEQPNGTNADIVLNGDEKDFAVGDLNRDGWPDLLVAKKVQASFIGARPARLFLNEKGTLVDRTDQYGSLSLSVGLGDEGFKHPLEARDLEIGDLDGDGWDDVVSMQNDLVNQTAASFKRITHPRVYMNLGNDPSGNWLGLIHDDSRIPQLLTNPGGLNGVVRHMDGALGDVDKDGDLDLYVSDFDTDENGHPEPSNLDLNDRLLINDGNGYFVDETSLRFATAAMWSSAFGTQSQIVDMNGDTKPDIVKVSTLTESPNRVEVLYNHLHPVTPPNFLGGFDTIQQAVSGLPYGFAISDLNNDGRLDLVVGNDDTDRYYFNTGLDLTNGTAKWSTSHNVTWLSGSGDGGFMGQMYATDYDLDGWNDVIVTDVNADLAGCNRRTQIYHNRGGVPGATDIVLAEEKQQSGSGGWFGAVGWSGTYPKGVNDVANIDFDRDGDLDLILGRCAGTDVWRNETNPVVCQPSVVPVSLGDGQLSMCGQPLYSNLTSSLQLADGPPLGLAVVLAGLTPTTSPFFGGQVILPFLVAFPLGIDANGAFAVPVPGGGGPPTGLVFYIQAILVPPGGSTPSELTNVLAATLYD